MTERGFIDPLLMNQPGSLIMIDDDNELAPENVPNNNSNANIQFLEWGLNGNICNWTQTGATKVQACILFFCKRYSPHHFSCSNFSFPSLLLLM